MATKMARAMATQFGMSDKLGPLAYGDNEEEVFLGHSVARTQSVSDETQKLVDQEVKRFVNDGYETATKILKKHIGELHKIAEGLLEYETLSGDEIKNLLEGKAPVREDVDTEPGERASAVPTAGSGRSSGKKKPDPDSGGMEPQPQS
jgi:cell division protease FtsH